MTRSRGALSCLRGTVAGALMLGACFDAHLEVTQRSPKDDQPATFSSDAGPIEDDRLSADAEPSDEHSTRHPSCGSAPPVVLPTISGAGEEAFAEQVNAFVDVRCEEALAWPTCSPDTPCPYDRPRCIRTGPDSEGVCTSAGPWDDNTTTPLVYRDGSCHEQVNRVEKAAICCRGYAGFDCRSYPFKAKSPPGGLCFSHDDCESGLLCRGVCVCPEVRAFAARSDCREDFEPRLWIGTHLPQVEVGACVESAPGFIAEALSSARSWSPRATLAPDGAIQVAYRNESTLSGVMRSVLRDGRFEHDELEYLDRPISYAYYYGDPAELKVTPDGVAHLLLTPYGVYHAVETALGWPLESVVGEDVSVTWASQAFSGESLQHVAYVGNGDMYYATRDAAGSYASEWVSLTNPVQSFRFLLLEEQPHIFMSGAGELELWHFTRSTEQSWGLTSYQGVGSFEVLSDREGLRIVFGRTGELWLGRLGDTLHEELKLWTQPRSRYQRRPPQVQAALAADGRLFIAHETPEGWALTVVSPGGGFETALMTTDLSEASLVLDARAVPHLFLAGGRQLYHVSTGSCP